MHLFVSWPVYLFFLLGPLLPYSFFVPAPAGEDCANGIDDDGDGLIDLNDPDCDCPLLEPVSLIPNPSFEENKCCPQTRSQLYCAETWIQASEATTDYINTCGWSGWPNLPVPLPIPDGTACVGFRNGRFGEESQPNWKEYAGACLLSPLRKGIDYRIKFHIGFVDPLHSPPTEIVIFGTPDCQYLPFGIGDTGHGCPTNGEGWIKLGSAWIGGGYGWTTSQIDLNPPEDIRAIAIGPNCREETYDTDLYYFFDNLVLDEENAFEFQIQARNHPCSELFSLEVPAEDTLGYQWYKDGIALPGATAPQLTVTTGEGRYQVRLSGPSTCQVTPAFYHRIPVVETSLDEYICAGRSYRFVDRSLAGAGTFRDTLKDVNNCDSIVTLQLEVVAEQVDSVQAQIFEGEVYEMAGRRFRSPGQHQLRLKSSLGCDSLVFLNLDYYDVFLPNAFSPNNDGINDIFIILGGNDLVEISSLQVFDRWGSLVFEGRNLPPGDGRSGWDGQGHNGPSPPGVYVYVGKVRMDDGKDHLLRGSVLLMR